MVGSLSMPKQAQTFPIQLNSLIRFEKCFLKVTSPAGTSGSTHSLNHKATRKGILHRECQITLEHTGFNLAVESRIRVNAERNFTVLLLLMQCQQQLRERVYAAAGSNAEVLTSARRMQSVFQHDLSQENAIFFAERLAETVIGTSDRNYSHLHKHVIALLVRGEQGRDDEPASFTDEEALCLYVRPLCH